MTSARHRILIGAICATLGGCGSVATMHLDTGGRADGIIVASDAQSVTLDEAAVRNGPSLQHPAVHHDALAIRRDAIADIDHPGTVMMVTGGALALGGLTMTTLAVIASERGSSTLRDPVTGDVVGYADSGGWGPLFLGGLLTTAVGAGFIWMGADTWLDSKAMVESGLSVQVGPTGAVVGGVF